MYTACRLGSRILFSTIREVVATHTAYTIVVLVATSFFLTRLRNRKRRRKAPNAHHVVVVVVGFSPLSLFFSQPAFPVGVRTFLNWDAFPALALVGQPLLVELHLLWRLENRRAPTTRRRSSARNLLVVYTITRHGHHRHLGLFATATLYPNSSG